MTSSLKRRSLSKPQKGEEISLYDLSFVRGRNKNHAHSMMLEAFQESGLTKAELAQMLGKKPEQITRWLGGPGNVTLNTLSDLLYAINGSFMEVRCLDDLSRPVSNLNAPQWLLDTADAERWTNVFYASTSDEASGIAVGSPSKFHLHIIENTTEERSYERYI